VLLVDHKSKSVATLVDRVLAMCLGEEIVTGRADEVMKNETRTRVFFFFFFISDGALETHARPEISLRTRWPHCRSRISAVLRQGEARRTSRSISIMGEFVSWSELNGAGKTTLFKRSRVLPYSGEIRPADGEKRAASARRKLARQRHRAVPGVPGVSAR